MRHRHRQRTCTERHLATGGRHTVTADSLQLRRECAPIQLHITNVHTPRGRQIEVALTGNSRWWRLTVFGLQMLCYLGPGADGQRSTGQRRVNRVWYVNAAEARLAQLMTGRYGQRFDQFLPPGQLTDRSSN